MKRRINESFGHWQSQKLAEIIRQHGMPNYGRLSLNYLLTQLRDDNIVGVCPRKEISQNTSQFVYDIILGDGYGLLFNTNNNKVASNFVHQWASEFSREAVGAVRPNNEFAMARDYNDVPDDYYSRKYFQPSTTRGESARDLRNNGYFWDKKPRSRGGEGWEESERQNALNNLRNGKDRWGNDNKRITENRKYMRNRIKLNESQLEEIIMESVKNVLNEANFFGGLRRAHNLGSTKDYLTNKNYRKRVKKSVDRDKERGLSGYHKKSDYNKKKTSDNEEVFNI